MLCLIAILLIGRSFLGNIQILQGHCHLLFRADNYLRQAVLWIQSMPFLP